MIYFENQTFTPQISGVIAPNQMTPVRGTPDIGQGKAIQDYFQEKNQEQAKFHR